MPTTDAFLADTFVLLSLSYSLRSSSLIPRHRNSPWLSLQTKDHRVKKPWSEVK
ncbi:MAG: hypothetical protein ACYST9_04170 [Planctomycetota bacterium]